MHARTLSTLTMVLAALGSAAAVATATHQTPRAGHASPARTRSDLARAYGHLPLAFEANRGQTDARARFLARGPGYNLFLTPRGAIMGLKRNGHGQVGLGLHFVGARGNTPLTGAHALPGHVNYLGRDRAHSQVGLPTFGQVGYRGVWDGIDAVFYGRAGALEYDLRVAPGANPNRIGLRFAGARDVRLGREGNLRVSLPGGGSISELAPKAYQVVGGRRETVASRYVLAPGGVVRVELGAYDRHRPLTIDPTVSYATYLGGSGEDQGQAIAIDGSGNAYVTGNSASTNFPTVGAIESSNAGGDNSAFVTKLSSNGKTRTYSTYLGVASSAAGIGIAVDTTGRAYVTGNSNGNFPTTDGTGGTVAAYQDTGGDMWFSVLNVAGSALVYSTEFGANSQVQGIAVDPSGNAYLTGLAPQDGIPELHSLKASGTDDDAFVAKINPAVGGSAGLLYSTRLGGTGGETGRGIAVDSSGNAYVTGDTYSTNFPCTVVRFSCTLDAGGSLQRDDAFVSKLTFSASTLTNAYSTLYGGGNYDQGNGIAVDSTGKAYVTGNAWSNDLPTQNAFDSGPGTGHPAWVAKFDPGAATNAASLLYATYLDSGNFGNSTAQGIAVDSGGHAFVTGSTDDDQFPQRNSFQGFNNGALSGNLDAFVAELDPALSGNASLIYSSFLGGSRDEYVATFGTEGGNPIAVNSTGTTTYLTGTTASADFPTTPSDVSQPTFGSLASLSTPNPTNDAYVVKLDNTGTPPQTTSTQVICVNPNFNATAACTATVTATNGAQTPPSGTVTFSTDGSGFFSPAATCTLATNGASTSACTVNYGSSQVGDHTVTGHYNGDSTHQTSSGSTQVSVIGPASGNGGNGNGTGANGNGTGGNGNGNGGNGNGATVPAATSEVSDIAAAKIPACLSIPAVVRNRVGQAPGGGAVTLKTKQVDDPAHPLTLATTRSGKAAIKSVSFTVNGHALKNTSKVNVTWLKTGSGKVNVVVATVKLRNGKTVKLTQKLIILRCHPPAAACTRQANGLSLSCQSKTPLGGRKVSVTVTRPPTDKASGSASVTKGRYTIVVHSSRALSAGTYAYKAVVTTGHRGERFQMIRLVTVK